MVIQAVVDVLLIGINLPPDLGKWAHSVDASILGKESIQDLIWKIRRSGPSVVVVLVDSAEDCAIISRMRNVRPRMRVIAVPRANSPTLEARVSQAGPTFYHADCRDIEGLNQLVFGSNRPPPEWLNDKRRIEIFIDPGDASKETIQAVLERLDDLHRAAGGLGLEFTVDEQDVRVMAGATV